MFYTNKSIRLHTRCLNYLELIRQSNNRWENKRADLTRYDADNKGITIIRLMYNREYITGQMERWGNLSDWLVLRMQNVLMELNQENNNQLRKLLIESETKLNNEVNTIDL